MDSASAILACAMGLLKTWQLPSPRTSDTTESEEGREAERKEERSRICTEVENEKLL